MAFWSWSRTASSNSTADGTINWAEGQAPSSVNDSARAMMARTAEYRDDIAGAIVTGGTSTGYTVTSFEVFDTLAHMNGQMIAFSPHTTNGATVTLNVDGLGAKPLRSSPAVELQAGTLVQGTPYVATYNNSDAAWYLQNFYGNPYNIPLAGVLPFFGSSVPNSSFAFPAGQAISQTTYAGLFAIFGSNKYGTDSGGNFSLPDLTGRVLAGREGSATRLTSTYFGGNSTVLGAVGGVESNTLVTGNLPPYTPGGTTAPNAGGINPLAVAAGSGTTSFNSGTPVANGYAIATFFTLTAPFTGTAQGGVSTPIRTVQPTIVSNYIMRII